MANVNIYNTTKETLATPNQENEGLGIVAREIFSHYEDRLKFELERVRRELGDIQPTMVVTEPQAQHPEIEGVVEIAPSSNRSPISSTAATAERRARRPVTQAETPQGSISLLSIFEKAANYFRRDNNPAQIFRQRQEAKQKNKAA